jgi:hypothetical protein
MGNENYWKIEARMQGFVRASKIDHTNPDYETVIYLMEERGEL